MPSKKVRLRLYADENFPVPSSRVLKSRGVSVIHSYDLNLINKSDYVHIKKAKSLKRTVITIDRDYLYYTPIKTKDSYGAIVISTGNVTPENIDLICQKALPKISPRSVKGALVKTTSNVITFQRRNSTRKVYF